MITHVFDDIFINTIGHHHFTLFTFKSIGMKIHLILAKFIFTFVERTWKKSSGWAFLCFVFNIGMVFQFKILLFASRYVTFEDKFFNEGLLKILNWNVLIHVNFTRKTTFFDFIFIWFLYTALTEQRLAMGALNTW